MQSKLNRRRSRRYLFGAAHEQFPPDDLLRQAVEAEEAGFDGVAASDHFQPWWEPGESGMAWVWLGAVGQATRRVSIGTGVTPALSRYHPALVAREGRGARRGPVRRRPLDAGRPGVGD